MVSELDKSRGIFGSCENLLNGKLTAKTDASLYRF